MNMIAAYLDDLMVQAENSLWRMGLLIRGEPQWQQHVLMHFLAKNEGQAIFQLGGEPLPCVRYAPFNKGQQFLGQECHLLICDNHHGFDANSFSAALGSLVGGGLLLIIEAPQRNDSFAERWLTRALEQLVVIEQNQPCPPLPVYPRVSSQSPIYEQQVDAVSAILRVMDGHRKRPLVLTADRGRGKSSALGIAAAKLMASRSLDIVVTAPSIHAVAPIFEHAAKGLAGAHVTRQSLTWQNSSLTFVAPDELILHRPQCDLLLVDEAAALPLSMLKNWVEHYHRAVFSTTIHGYEGCGRGFTLKFQTWLAHHRAGTRTLHLDQPIRWRQGDPLEAWHYDTFLLRYDLATLPTMTSEQLATLNIEHLDKAQLIANPTRLAAIFSLLVNAHYQTSPNDLFHFLADDKVQLVAAMVGEVCVGCLLTVREGGLCSALVEEIQRGKRRPKGHLVPVCLANQVGITQAAQSVCQRIMRIAVHPELQNQGLGSRLIEACMLENDADYLATSFGVTSDLMAFWAKNQFIPIKLGSHRDSASGCFSLIMVQAEKLDWLTRAEQIFEQHFIFSLSDSLQSLEPALVRAILPLVRDRVACADSNEVNFLPYSLLRCYAQGGADYESVSVWIHRLITSLDKAALSLLSDVLIAKVLQRKSWQECASQLNLTGRKMIEATLRHDLNRLLDDLHCKVDHSTQ
ncbi:tRNA(Met) cytidine acetyltransferase TmcA [Vibrio ordalii]|uniref:tRNA(Met) cytidine acetyltransferase TmcA n=1 Tax=Vibrio ordalii FS-238 TaxID=617133 RepID=A0A853QU13_9VIBR|nr:GNAT family N-acetyltransferase [Vibrio ordalii]OEE32503.1 tRNA cytosine(34) acetyltransferase TmcA [Vibrio ordalii FS-238]